MLTGVEIAGIILAVIPLCISILENHQAEIQPLKSLLDFRSQYAKSCGDLEIRMQQLDMMMDLLFAQAEILTDGQGIGSLVATYDAGVWVRGDKQQKLIAYLGHQVYNSNFELIIKRIRSDVADIASILDLGSYRESKDDPYIWNSLKRAKQQIANPGVQTRLSKKTLKTRAKFVFEGGIMDHKLQNMERNMNLLHNTIQNKAMLRQIQASTNVSGPHLSARSHFPTFAPPLTNIIGYARRFHDALQSIRNCPHCGHRPVNLKLDRRLRSSDNYGSPEGVQFTLACELCSKSRITWKLLEISAQPSGDGDERGNEALWGHKAVATPTRSTGMSLHQIAYKDSVSDLCHSMSENLAGRNPAHFYINQHNQVIHGEDKFMYRSTPRPPNHISSFISLGDLFRSPRSVTILSDPLTIERSISLGTEVVSAIVQLSATRWIQGVCRSDAMYLPATDGVIDKSECYVRVTLASLVSTEPVDSTYRGEAFILLATTLLELALQTPILVLRSLNAATADLPLQDTKRITDSALDVAILEDIFDKYRGKIQPSLRQAILYCLSASRNKFADMKSPDTQSEMIREMLAPLESELQNWA